jgi:hypothetical protein
MTDYTWDGGGDGTSWNDADNWGGSDYPRTNNDKATINVGSASISMDIPGGTGVVGEVELGSSFSGTVTQAYNFTIDDAGSENGQLSIDGGTWSTNNALLTVDGQVHLNGGTLDCTASTISFGQADLSPADSTWGLRVQSGTFTGGTGDHTISSLYSQGGTTTLTSGDTLFNGFNTSSASPLKVIGGTWSQTAGKVIFNGTNQQALHLQKSIQFHDVEFKFAYEMEVFNWGVSYNITIGGTLTIDASSGFNTKYVGGGADYDNVLTVTGDATINGTLDTYGNGGGKSATFGSLTIGSSGTYEATSGTTTITSIASSWSVDLVSGGTLTDNNGTFLFNSASDQKVRLLGTGNFHNVTVNKSDNDMVQGSNLTIEGDLSITLETTHTFRPNSASHTLTLTGDVTIVEGKLGDVTNYTGAISFGSLTIESGGTYIATSDTTNITSGDFDNTGTFTHNDGMVKFNHATNTQNINENGTAQPTFYKLDTAQPAVGGATVIVWKDITVIHTLSQTGGRYFQFKGDQGSLTVTLGSSTVACTVTEGNRCLATLSGAGPVKFYGADQLKPWVITTGGPNHACTEVHYKWGDYSADTFNTQHNITIDGDMKFGAFNVNAGDELDLNGQRVEFTGAFDLTASTSAIKMNDAMAVFTNTIDFNGRVPTSNTGTTIIHNPPSTSEKLITSLYFGGTFFAQGAESDVNGYAWGGSSGSGEYPAKIFVGGQLDCQQSVKTGELHLASGGELRGNDRTITLEGDFTSSGGLIGKSAAVFNGSSEEADFGDPSEFELTSTMTIEAWVKPDSASSGLLQGIVGKVLFGGAGSKEWGLSSNSAKWFFKCGNDTSNGTIESDDNYTTGKWYHIACTKDSSGVMRMYVDGKMQTTTQTVTGDCNPTYNFVMGRRASAADYFFDGTLGLVRIFNTERTVTQIRTDMFNDFSNMDSTTGLVACYQFDKGTGTTIYDSTTNDLDSSSSDATWAGGGTFTYGTSTLDLTGTGDLSYEGNINFYNLKCAASTKTTTVNRRSAGSIYIRNNLYHGGGTLDRSGSVTYAFMGIASAPLSGATSPIDMSNCYVVYWGSTGVVPASTWEYFISDVSPVTLGADVTSNNYFNTSTYETALAGNTLTVNEMKFGNSANAHLNIGSGSLVLANTLGVSTSYAGNQLSAGPGATISGTAAGTTFKSQNDWKVVGTVENLNVTNEELNVTGKIINCTGDIIQQHQSIDAAQQLDYDSAEDRDIILGRDLDKNTELVG